MKTKAFGVLVAAFLSVTVLGQGTILFDTFIPGQVDARAVRSDGTGAGAGVTAQLFLITQGPMHPIWTPLFPTTTFQSSSPVLQYYVNPVVVEVPGVPAGSSATVAMRAWFGERYEGSLTGGESTAITISELGGIPPGGGERIPDALLVGLLGFSVGIPEPSVMALAILGAVGLLMRRRK